MALTPADTLARLVAWLTAVDAALADGADPAAVLAHVQTVALRIAWDTQPPGKLVVLSGGDLDAAYQARTWRRAHGCEGLS